MTCSFPEYEIPNQQVRSHATEIADAALILYEHMKKEHKCVPSVLLEGAFAIELYLKCLNSKTVAHPLADSSSVQLTAEPMTHSHYLQQIFDGINQMIRDELQQAYAEDPVIAGVAQLRDALGRYNNLFVDIRYVFDKPAWIGHSINDFINLLQFIRKQVDVMPRRYGTA